MKKVIIKNLKNITNLEFQIPDSGVWVLTGRNGSGKSTLLGVLWRIKEPNAFQRHFPSSKDTELDNYEGAEISYIITENGEEKAVTYTRRDIRWPPTPKKNKSILDGFGYKKVEFIKVDERRIFPREEEFQPNKSRIKDVSDFIKNGANTTFNTNKFKRLKVFNAARGVTPAYLIEIEKRKWYSEKNFSLGELNVIRLLGRLEQLRDKENSLILIDEFDMALHPIAQINLIDVLEKYVEDNNHTIIFSTHSASIIRHIDRQKIIHIDVDKNYKFKIIKGPPLYKVLEDISGKIHLTEGPRVFCEDEYAKEFILTAYAKYVEKNKIDPISFTPIKCGSWTEVITRAKETSADGCPFIAIPDADVLDTPKYDELIKPIKEQVRPLPVTPEVSIAYHFIEDRDNFLDELQKILLNNSIPFSRDNLEKIINGLKLDRNKIKTEIDTAGGKKRRDACKKIIKCIRKELQLYIPNHDIHITFFVKAAMNLEFKNKYMCEKWCMVMGELHKLLKNG